MGLAVFSHWILDLIVHRPDLSLYDNTFKMGFGLWNHRIIAFILEIGLLLTGAVLYLGKRSQKKGRMVSVICVLVLIQIIGTFLAPPPTSDRAEAWTALFFYFLFAAAAWWAESSSEPEAPRKGETLAAKVTR